MRGLFARQSVSRFSLSLGTDAQSMPKRDSACRPRSCVGRCLCQIEIGKPGEKRCSQELEVADIDGGSCEYFIDACGEPACSTLAACSTSSIARKAASALRRSASMCRSGDRALKGSLARGRGNKSKHRPRSSYGVTGIDKHSPIRSSEEFVFLSGALLGPMRPTRLISQSWHPATETNSWHSCSPGSRDREGSFCRKLARAR